MSLAEERRVGDEGQLPVDVEPVVGYDEVEDERRDIGDVPAIEVINTVAVHLLSAAAVKCGLADEPDAEPDLDEARKLIDALAGLVTAAAPHLGDHHARALRDGLRSLQLAFREASPFPDEIGKGPGEKWTGPVT
jgi:MoxR-like ATPase